MFALVKPFLIAVGVIIFLFFAIGVIKIEKPEYGCLTGKKLRFAEKTEVISVGSFRMYAYPIVADCPEDDRYDPQTVYKCGTAQYCQKDKDEQQEQR